jgi:hypothetical protein
MSAARTFTTTNLVRGRQKWNLREVDPIQVAGILLAGLLVIGMVVVTIAIVWFAQMAALPNMPAAPGAPSNENVALYKQLVDIYKTQNDIQLSRFTQIFQPVVATVLLPVLTAVIGYTLGSKKSA